MGNAKIKPISRKGRKTAFKYVKRQLTNAIVEHSAHVCYDAAPGDFTEFMRYLFGDKNGSKIINYITGRDEYPYTDEYDDDEISWDDFDNRLHDLCVEECERTGEHMYDFELPGNKFYAVHDAINMAIDNGDLKSFGFDLAFMSPFFTCGKTVDIDESVMSKISNTNELKEAIYYTICKAIPDIASAFDSIIDRTTLPEIIKCRCHACSNRMREIVDADCRSLSLAACLTSKVYSVVALLSATGEYAESNRYTPKFTPEYIGQCAQGNAWLGVLNVSIRIINAVDQEESRVYDTDVPPYTSVNSEIFEILDTHNSQHEDDSTAVREVNGTSDGVFDK